jgi:hypothetical protein
VKAQVRGPAIAEMQRAVTDDPMLGGWLSGETVDAAAGILTPPS